MKDQLKKEAIESLTVLDSLLDKVHKVKEDGHSSPIHASAKSVLLGLDDKLTSMSGEIPGWKYDVLSAILKGAHEEVDFGIANSDQYKMGDIKHGIHKAANMLAKALVKSL